MSSDGRRYRSLPAKHAGRFQHRDASRAVRGLRWRENDAARPEAPPTPPIAPAPAAQAPATKKEQ